MWYSLILGGINYARGYRMFTTDEALEKVMSKYHKTVEVLKGN